MTASPTDDLASAERRIQELTKELSRARGELSQARGEFAEAREQQAATAGANTRLFEEAQTRNTELRPHSNSKQQQATSSASSAARPPTSNPSSTPLFRMLSASSMATQRRSRPLLARKFISE